MTCSDSTTWPLVIAGAFAITLACVGFAAFVIVSIIDTMRGWRER